MGACVVPTSSTASARNAQEGLCRLLSGHRHFWYRIWQNRILSPADLRDDLPRGAYLACDPKLKDWRPWWRPVVIDQEVTWKDVRRGASSALDLVTFMRDAEAGERTKAVRALVLYPMNALVEDQLVRLRRALDSDEAHVAMDRHFGGTASFSDATLAQRPSLGSCVIRVSRSSMPRRGNGAASRRASRRGFVGLPHESRTHLFCSARRSWQPP